MSLIPVPNCGAAGVIKDLSVHELPLGAWTDALNVRFLDGYAYQFLGQGQVYNTPSFAPQYVMPVSVVGVRYWLYATATKQFVVANSGGVAVHTDITHATPRAGVVNNWTGAVFGGIPILNAGDGTHVPMFWNQQLASKFADLTAWPAATYCKVIRSYAPYLIALGITDARGDLPYMVKWSNEADAGALPSTWNPADATQSAGEYNLSDGQDIIIDGLKLRDSFMIYKEASIWRMDKIGGNFVFSFRQVLGTSGAMNRNCIVEIDGVHCVLTGSDVIIHDGQQPVSILDKLARRYFFQNIDVSAKSKCFLFKNPFLNEVFICYPSIGSAVCNRAMVFNYKDRTVSFREMPNVNHADVGLVDNTLGSAWDTDVDQWDSDLTLWNGPDYTPDTQRVIMGSANTKLYMLDASASFDGVMVNSFLERRGLSFDAPNLIKLVRGIRLRITGNVGQTVIVKIGYADDPYADPIYPVTMTHTIGETVSDDCFVSGRYIAIRIESGTAAQWRLDSFSLDIEQLGEW